MKALEVKNLSKNFGGVKVLSDISFSVEQGERRAIIGPNGAGKTTLFNIISGLIIPNNGEILFFDSDITKLAAYHRARLGVSRTFQKNNLFFSLSLYDNLKFASKGKDTKISPVELLKRSGLEDRMEKKLGELSYGEQRQVEILLALAQSPKILLLDEPTAGMSSVETETITGMIAALPKDITVILIEHDMDVVFNIADRVTVLHHGGIICEGDKAMVRADPRVKEVYLGTTEEEVKCNAETT